MTATAVGCALLTKPHSLASGGWASISGSEPFRFDTIEALGAAGALWVVSTPEAAFQTEGGPSHRFLRHASFLPTPVTGIAEEVAPKSDKALAAQRVSEVLTRVVALADQIAPVSRELAHEVAPATLTIALQRLIAPLLRRDVVPAEFAEAMPSLFKAPPPLASAQRTDIAVRIPVNRIALAELAFEREVPGSNWAEVPHDAYPNLLNWAIGDRKPVIAKVRIKGLQPKLKSVAPIWSQLSRGAVRWLALPEIEIMSKILEMKAERVFVADDSVPAGASLRVPQPVFSPAAVGSISAQLFAETYLVASCTPSSLATHQGAVTIEQSHSVRAAWMTASCRAAVLREATDLSAAGYSVIGYGPTHVLVAIPKRNLRQLRRTIAVSRMLVYPAGMRDEEEPLAPADQGQLADAYGGAY